MAILSPEDAWHLEGGVGTGGSTITRREFGGVHRECTACRRGSDKSATKLEEFLRGTLNTSTAGILIWKQFASSQLGVWLRQGLNTEARASIQPNYVAA